jgi:type IV pilus assembly protein PilM
LTFAKIVRIPNVAARQRRKIIRFEARQSLPSSLAEVVWTAATVTGNGNGRDVALTAARRPLIEALCTRLREAGFAPRAILPSWFVLRHGAGGAVPPAGGPALVLCVGARSTHLVLSEAKRCFLRTFALGGNAVTQRIAEELGTDYAHAEALKERVCSGGANAAGDSPEDTAVAIAADEFVRRVGGEMSRSLASLFPEGDAGRPAVLRLSGSGSLLPGLAPALAERLRLRIERWDVRPSLSPGAAVAGLSRGPDIAALADLSGLAGGAVSREAAGANLLPRAWRWGTRLRRWWRVVVTAALLVGAGLGWAAWQTRVKAAAIRGRMAEVDRKIEILGALDRRNHENLARLAAMNRRIAGLRRVVDARSAWIAFLADLQERLTETGDAWLDSLRIAPSAPVSTIASGAWSADPSSASEGGQAGRPQLAPPTKLDLAGYILDADTPLARAGEAARDRARTLLAQLRASPFVAGIEAERFDSSRPGLLRFELTLVLAPRTLF